MAYEAARYGALLAARAPGSDMDGRVLAAAATEAVLEMTSAPETSAVVAKSDLLMIFMTNPFFNLI
jgi:hypothetical protein